MDLHVKPDGEKTLTCKKGIDKKLKAVYSFFFDIQIFAKQILQAKIKKLLRLNIA